MNREQTKSYFNIFLAISLILSISGEAQAASFDCTKAKSTTEKLICETPEISKLDEELSKAYKALSGELTKSSAETLKKSQKSWLRTWPVACHLKKSRDVSCVVAQYKGRIDLLNKRQDFEGFKTFQMHFVGAQHNTEMVEMHGEVLTQSVTFPQVIDGDLSGDRLKLAEALNAWLKPSDDTLNDSQENMTHHRTLKKVTNELWHVAVRQESFGPSSPHEFTMMKNLWFKVSEARPLKVEDVFTTEAGDENVMMNLPGLVISKLKQQQSELINDDISASVMNPSAWRFDQDRFILEFNRGEITHHSEPAPEVIFEWYEIDELLSPSFPLGKDQLTVLGANLKEGLIAYKQRYINPVNHFKLDSNNEADACSSPIYELIDCGYKKLKPGEGIRYGIWSLKERKMTHTWDVFKGGVKKEQCSSAKETKEAYAAAKQFFKEHNIDVKNGLSSVRPSPNNDFRFKIKGQTITLNAKKGFGEPIDEPSGMKAQMNLSFSNGSKLAYQTNFIFYAQMGGRGQLSAPQAFVIDDAVILLEKRFEGFCDEEKTEFRFSPVIKF